MSILTLLLILLCIPFLPRLIAAYLESFIDAPRAMRRLGNESWFMAGRQMTLNGKLSMDEVSTFYGGSLVLSAALVALAVMGYHLFLPALGPIFGLPAQAVQFDSDSQDLLAKSTIYVALLVPFVAGVVISDLIGWSQWSPFALAPRGRRGAYYMAFAVFVCSLLVAASVGIFRTSVELEMTIGLERSEMLASWASSFVIFSIDWLVVFAVFLCAPSLEAVFRLMGAVICATASVALHIGSLALRLIHTILEPANVWIQRFTSSATKSISSAYHTKNQGLDDLLNGTKSERPQHTKTLKSDVGGTPS